MNAPEMHGKKIVFSNDQLRGPDYASSDLFVMNADGSNEHRIVDDQQFAIGGDWSAGVR